MSAGRGNLSRALRRRVVGLLQVQRECNAIAVKRSLAKPTERASRSTVGRDWKWGSKMISVTDRMPPGFKASKISLSAASRSGTSPRTVTSTERSNRSRPSLPSPSPPSRNRILARFAAAAFSRALKHAGLNIHSHDFALRPDAPRDRDGKSAGTAAGIQHGHARLQLQTLDDGRCPIGLREGIVELHQPAQPYRTGDRTAAGTDAPYDGDESDDDDQTEKGVRGRHGSRTQARSTVRRLRSASEQ